MTKNSVTVTVVCPLCKAHTEMDAEQVAQFVEDVGPLASDDVTHLEWEEECWGCSMIIAQLGG
jgi:hypothetical protein